MLLTSRSPTPKIGVNLIMAERTPRFWGFYGAGSRGVWVRGFGGGLRHRLALAGCRQRRPEQQRCVETEQHSEDTLHPCVHTSIKAPVRGASPGRGPRVRGVCVPRSRPGSAHAPGGPLRGTTWQRQPEPCSGLRPHSWLWSVQNATAKSGRDGSSLMHPGAPKASASVRR